MTTLSVAALLSVIRNHAPDGIHCAEVMAAVDGLERYISNAQRSQEVIGAPQEPLTDDEIDILARDREKGIGHVFAEERLIATVRQLQANVATLRGTMARFEVADSARVIAWARDPARKPPNNAFTAGAERQAAYWIEWARGEYASYAERRAEVLKFIAKFARDACVTDSRDVMDWHDDMNYLAVVAERALAPDPDSYAIALHSDGTSTDMKVEPGFHNCTFVNDTTRTIQVGDETPKKVPASGQIAWPDHLKPINGNEESVK